MWTAIIMKNMHLSLTYAIVEDGSLFGQCLKHALKTQIVHVVDSATV